MEGLTFFHMGPLPPIPRPLVAWRSARPTGRKAFGSTSDSVAGLLGLVDMGVVGELLDHLVGEGEESWWRIVRSYDATRSGFSVRLSGNLNQPAKLQPSCLLRGSSIACLADNSTAKLQRYLCFP